MEKKSIIAVASAACLLASAASCSGHKGETTREEDDGVQITTVKHPDWARQAVIYEVNLRQFTDSGTVTAFDAQLDRLKDLGIDILWFMPVNPISEKDRKGTLGSYYAVADYTGFNSEFGTVDQFKAVVKHAHDLGMHVILDWVANHSGRDNKWVNQHPDWYEKDETGNMKGVYDWTDVYVFDYDNPEMRQGMIDAMKYWLTEVDIDGFRCDVAMEVPTDFWDEARQELQTVKPDIFMLAEATVPELQADAFNMGYNWPMKDLFSEIAVTAGQFSVKVDDKKLNHLNERNARACDIDSLLRLQAKTFPRGTILMNMTSNHDLNSWEGTEFERLGNLSEALAALTYVLPGMPLIYTGQETGLDRALEFFEKDKAPQWEPRNEYFTLYQTLNNLKHQQRALSVGTDNDGWTWWPVESPDVIVIERQAGASRVLYIANLGSDVATVTYTGKAPSTKDLTKYMGTAEADAPTLHPGDYIIYVKG